MRIILALLIAAGTCFWLMLRRLKNIPLPERIIIALTLGVLFFRSILGETYFFAPQILFQALIFLLGFIYFLYLYMNKPQNICPNINMLDSQENDCLDSSDRFYFWFMFFLTISVVFSVNKDASISTLVYFWVLYVWYKLIRALPKSKTIRDLFQAMILCGGVLLVAYGVYQYCFGFNQMRQFVVENPQMMINSREFIRRLNANVVFSTFLYAPAFGSYLSMLFLTILGFTLAESDPKDGLKPGSAIKYLVLVLIIPLLVLTKAKGAWVALLISMFVFLKLSKPNRRKKDKLFIINAILGLLGLFAASYFLISFSDKIHLPKFTNFIASFQVRWEYWKAALAMIRQRPVLGFGPGTFGNVYPMFKTLLGEETIMAHNSYLQIWAEAGSFTFLMFILFWLSFMGSVIRKLTPISGRTRFIPIGLFCGVVSFILVNLIDFGLYDSQSALIAFGFMGLLQYQLDFAQKKQKNIQGSPESDNNPDGKLCPPNQWLIFISCLILTGLLGYSVLVYSARFFDEKASQEYKEGKFAQALSSSSTAISLQRLCARYYFHKGIILEKMYFNPDINAEQKDKLLNQAIDAFKTAIKLDPITPHYHYKLGVAVFYLDNEQSKQVAEEEFAKAAKLYPVNPFYHEQLSQLYEIMGQPENRDKENKQAEYLKKFYHTGTR